MSRSSSTSVSPERHVFPLLATLGGIAVTLECSAWCYPVSQTGLTLIITHSISGHKEQYHTAITRLLSLRERATYDIREIWTIDFPNHGEAAILNRRILEEYKANNFPKGTNGTCTIMDCSAHLNSFLSLPRFQGHTVVGMGYSGSCTMWIHALTKFAPPKYPTALILLEPTIMFPSLSAADRRAIHGAANVRGALAKQDRWASRADFRQWLATRGKRIWGRWDPRVLDLYVEYALEEVAVTSSDAQGRRRGSYVTPRVRKDEEAPMYAVLAHTIEPSQLSVVCKALNGAGKRGVHLIWAELEEFISKTAKDDMLDAAEHRIATQRTIMGSGHLVAQLKPDELGDAMHEVLELVASGPTQRSKL